ncbi:hypothetical protein BDP27DRAFT_1019559 [Rhodocollybia butyracea]|uniref:Uncharacterized protein n=1 Tax=Rhodocollybia butyracea TaxID=206335 RepID=A0A9P5PR02_9AGAR|nr:hypothetical protein BDP27DRAFT_1019559 [Rhodocollybia butyracea]
MTPEEVSAIKHLGSLVFLNSAVETLNCVLYGIYCLALAIAIYIYYVGNGGIGCAKKKMLCLLLVSFIGVSIVLFIPAAEALVQIEDPLIVSIPGGGIVPSAIVNSELLLEVCSQMSDWVSIIILLTANTVIVWRAWSVWTDNKTVQRILLFSMLANIDSQLSLNIHDTGHALTLDWVAFMMSLSVNIIATSLIAFQAWEHHKSTKYLSMGKKKTKGEGILLILVESGAVYALFQVSFKTRCTWIVWNAEIFSFLP